MIGGVKKFLGGGVNKIAQHKMNNIRTAFLYPLDCKM